MMIKIIDDGDDGEQTKKNFFFLNQSKRNVECNKKNEIIITIK